MSPGPDLLPPTRRIPFLKLIKIMCWGNSFTIPPKTHPQVSNRVTRLVYTHNCLHLSPSMTGEVPGRSLERRCRVSALDRMGLLVNPADTRCVCCVAQHFSELTNSRCSSWVSAEKKSGPAPLPNILLSLAIHSWVLKDSNPQLQTPDRLFCNFTCPSQEENNENQLLSQSLHHLLSQNGGVLPHSLCLLGLNIDDPSHKPQEMLPSVTWNCPSV